MAKRGKKKSPRWLREQRAQKKVFFLFWLRFLFFAGLFFLLAFLSFIIVKQFRKRLWDDKNNFNFAVLTEKGEMFVISCHPRQDKVNLIYLSPQAYVPLAKGFGDYPVSSIWSLGELEKFGGGELVKLSAQHLLGVPIQGWGRIENTQINKYSNKQILKNGMSKRGLIRLIVRLAFGGETNLSRLDLARMFWKIAFLDNSKIDFYFLDETRASEEVILPDGSKAFRIQKDFLDRLTGEVFKDELFLEEGIIFGVVNITDYSGLANQVARLIDNIGGEVVVIAATQKTFAQEGIYCWNKEICQSYSLKLLAEVLHLEIIEQQVEETRVEALVVLGEGYWRLFYKR